MSEEVNVPEGPKIRRLPRVSVALLTYNRRALLSEGLAALRAQTLPVHAIHVVDNASTDGTAEFLAAQKDVRSVRLGRNAGGAGGFARAVEEARADPDADWILLMDDDAAPRADCLERLLASPAAADPATVAVCPAVVDPSGRVQEAHRGVFAGRPRGLPRAAYAGNPELGYASFVGLLVRAGAARTLAPPRAEFFIWADDFEYCLRLRRLGAIRLVPEAEIVHAEAQADYANRRSRLWNRLFGWDFAPTRHRAAWRNLYGLRNYAWMKREHEDQGLLAFAGTVAQFALKALLYDEKPLRRVPRLVVYAVRGRHGVFVNDAHPGA